MKNWKLWHKFPEYGDVLYKRAIGIYGEMESSKSLSALLKKLYLPGLKVCDVGCGAGHYLFSFRKRIDKGIDYTGVDSTKYYIKLAQKAFNNKKIFMVGDIMDLPFTKDSYDIVICCNLILHLPPPPLKPLSELIRIAKKYVVIRTLIGESNYIIKRIYEPKELGVKNLKELDLVKTDDKINNFGFLNMYTESYFKELIISIDKSLKIKIVKDTNFKNFDNSKFSIRLPKMATKVINGKQISGNLIYDWRYIIIEK